MIHNMTIYVKLFNLGFMQIDVDQDIVSNIYGKKLIIQNARKKNAGSQFLECMVLQYQVIQYV